LEGKEKKPLKSFSLSFSPGDHWGYLRNFFIFVFTLPLFSIDTFLRRFFKRKTVLRNLLLSTTILSRIPSQRIYF